MEDELKPDVSTEEKEKQENNDQPVDYYKQELARVEAEKAKEQEARIKAENAIIGLKRKQKEDIEEEDEPKEDIAEIVKSQLSSFKNEILKETRQERMRGLVQSISSNPDEQALILHHYQTSIIPTGDLEADLRKAKAIANASKYEAEIAEKTRALQANANKGGNDSGAGNPSADEKPAPKLTAKERQFIGNDLGKGVVVKDGKLVSSAKEKFLKKRGLA